MDEDEIQRQKDEGEEIQLRGAEPYKFGLTESQLNAAEEHEWCMAQQSQDINDPLELQQEEEELKESALENPASIARISICL